MGDPANETHRPQSPPHPTLQGGVHPLMSLNVVKNLVDSAGGTHSSSVWMWYNKRDETLRIKVEWVKGVPSFFGSSYSLAPVHAPEPARVRGARPAVLPGTRYLDGTQPYRVLYPASDEDPGTVNYEVFVVP